MRPKPPVPDLDPLVARWNEATNRADAAALRALYAPSLSLYGRFVSREQASQLKAQAARAQAGFSQTVRNLAHAPRPNGDRAVVFEKTTHVPSGDRTVQAYLLWRRVDGEWRIIDEGDRETDRVLGERRDAFARQWRERVYQCPDCAAEGDEPPTAYPPLGPFRVPSAVPRPPGAPSSLEYGRLHLVRFASAVDVPLFLIASPRSSNGDGRWVTYDAPPEPDGTRRNLLNCALGGFWFDGPPPGGADPGHRSYPEITFTEETRRDAEGVQYEKVIYSPERIQNFVRCTLDPEYQDYFLPIVQRMGRSLRAIAGGPYARPERASAAY
jgi:hypothetical protein